MPKVDFRKVEDVPGPELVDEIFEEIGLVLGGLVAVHSMDPEDDFIWRLCKSLDVIRVKALKKISPDPSPWVKEPRLRPHPAIEELIRRCRDK